MFLCPECQQQQNNILNNSCTFCGASCEHLDGIFVLLSSMDKQSLLFRDYRKMYDQIAVEDLNVSFQNPEYLVIQNDKLFGYLPKKSGMSICEVGVGQGGVLKKLVNLSPSKLVGVDIASAYLKKMINERVPFEPFLMNAENLCFQEEFDLVVSTDVIEHVTGLGNYLLSIHRSLKNDGMFVVRTPYLEDYTFYSRFKGYKYDTMHLRNFSKKTLKIVLKGAGFRVKRFHYDGFMDHLFRPSTPRFLRKIIRWKYGSYLKLPAIPNWIGRLFIKPTEITAICEKQKKTERMKPERKLPPLDTGVVVQNGFSISSFSACSSWASKVDVLNQNQNASICITGGTEPWGYAAQTVISQSFSPSKHNEYWVKIRMKVVDGVCGICLMEGRKIKKEQIVFASPIEVDFYFLVDKFSKMSLIIRNGGQPQSVVEIYELSLMKTESTKQSLMPRLISRVLNAINYS